MRIKIPFFEITWEFRLAARTRPRSKDDPPVTEDRGADRDSDFSISE